MVDSVAHWDYMKSNLRL